MNERLLAIAARVPQGAVCADIGTDHAQLPIMLYKNGVSPRLILTDINEGPLRRARENLEQAFPQMSREAIERVFSLRLGDGLMPLAAAEADVAVIAGMGGETIASILTEDDANSKRLKLFILQPRTKCTELRERLNKSGFSIIAEDLAPEAGRICEIITAEYRSAGHETSGVGSAEAVQLQMLAENRHPLLSAFIEQKIRVEEKIIRDCELAGTEAAGSRAQLARERTALFLSYIDE
jgi:tRNA (adenine22-N1)-methyltransferase